MSKDGEIPPEVLVAGEPAKVKNKLDGCLAKWIASAEREYQELRLRYMK